jgi:hypothetical protein
MTVCAEINHAPTYLPSEEETQVIYWSQNFDQISFSVL